MTETRRYIEVSNLTDEALLRHFFGEEANLMLESCGTLANVVCQARPQYSAANTNMHVAMELAKRVNMARAADRLILSFPHTVAAYLRAHVEHLEHEVFIALWLDAQMGVLIAEEMFRGTLTQTSVYPREVVKRALQLNACNVIFAHNHPSGSAEPSNADKALTEHLAEALALIDVRVLDHYVIGCNDHTSFMQKNLLKPIRHARLK
jgi:DNA repair protein RadC